MSNDKSAKFLMCNPRMSGTTTVGLSLRVRLMIVMWIPASAGMTKLGVWDVWDNHSDLSLRGLRQVQLRLIFSAVEMVIGARVMKKTTMADRNQI